MRRMLPVVAALLCACAEGQPRRPVPPMIVAPVFPEGVDVRPIKAERRPRLWVAETRWPANALRDCVYSPSDVSASIRQAVGVYLGNVGLPVVDDEDQAEAVVRPIFLSLTCRSNAFAFWSEGDVSFRVALEDRAGNELWQATLGGRAHAKLRMMDIVHGPGFAAAMGNALVKLGPWLESDGVLAKIPIARAVAPVPASAPVAARPPGRSDVDEPPAAGAPRRGHAVVIGVERYRNGLPSADFAAGDARIVARYASAVLGYPAANVVLLADESATRSDMVKHLERRLANRVQPEDEVFVYFSGHGAPDPKTGESYLVPYDGDPAYLEETAYPVKRLYEALAKLPAKKIVVAMDSCFSGSGGRSVIAEGSRPLVTVAAAAVPKGLTVLSASSAAQTSNSYRMKSHGLFTYFLLKGLREGGADWRAAFDYLKPEVSRVARQDYNSDQEPQWREGR